MKRLSKSLLLCISLMLVFCCHAFAQGQEQGTCGTNVSYSVTEGTITFTKTNPASDAVWNNCGSIFKEKADIKKAVVNDPIKLTSGESLFSGYSHIQEMDLSKLDVSSVTSMRGMFFQCKSLTTLNVSGWNTAAVTDMSIMFEGCSSLKTVDVSGWNTAAVTDMGEMFYECASLTALDVSRWNTSRVTDMHAMFWKCSSLTTLAVGGWNTAAVTDMHGFFGECSSLTTLDVSRWKTSAVILMNGMFYNCASLTALNVRDWDISAAANISGLFSGCSSLTTLDVSGWNTSAATDMNHMFWECSSLAALDVSGWDTSRVTNMRQMFYNCKLLTALSVSGWNTATVKYMDEMFYGCSSLKMLDVSAWDTSAVTYMNRMFSGCSSLKMLDVSSWDTADVTYLDEVFDGTDGITKLILGEKSLSKNIFTSLPRYNAVWKYEETGGSASNPLPIGSIRENGTLFTAYDYASMAGTWVVTDKPDHRPENPTLHMFPILSGVKMLPVTGFSTRQAALLPERPRELVYAPLAMTLQIPLFDEEVELTRIPLTENSWSAEWLGEKGGVLEGYALPGEGYSVIAAHNTLDNTSYGPFARLSEMVEGDLIFVEKSNGSLLRFRVYANELILPDDFESLKQTAEREMDSLVLVTCENESVDGGYLNRRVVFAKPID